MSAVPTRRREGLDTIVGLVAAAAIVVSLLAMINLELSLAGVDFAARPVRLGVGAIALAIVAAAVGGRHSRLANAAVGITAFAWMVGMVIAVVTERPLY